MQFWDVILWISISFFGSLSAPFCIWQFGKILRDRRHDKMEEMRIKSQQKLEEMRIKADMDNRILGGASSVENMTAELQALRQEMSCLRGELDQLKSANRNFIGG